MKSHGNDMSSEPTPSRRDQNKERTRRALLSAARRLFAERGFDKVTISAICSEADVGRRTFFRYFPTKESLVFIEHEERLARLLKMLASGPADEPVFTTLRRLSRVFAEQYMADKEGIIAHQKFLASSTVLVAKEREIDRRWEASIAKLFRQRAGAEGPEVERWAGVVAGAAMGTVRATLRYWFVNGGTEDLVKLGEEALDSLETGFQHGWGAGAN